MRANVNYHGAFAAVALDYSEQLLSKSFLRILVEPVCLLL